MTPEAILSAAQLEVIKELVERLSPEPWFVETMRDGDRVTYAVADVVRWRGLRSNLDCADDGLLAVFIAHARTDVPALIATVEALLEAIRENVDTRREHETIARANGAYSDLVALADWFERINASDARLRALVEKEA